MKKKYLSKEEGGGSLTNVIILQYLMKKKKKMKLTAIDFFLSTKYFMLLHLTHDLVIKIFPRYVLMREITNDLIKQRNQFSLKQIFKKKILGNKSPHFHPIQKKVCILKKQRFNLEEKIFVREFHF